MSTSTYSLDALVQQQLEKEQQQEQADKLQRESDKQQAAGNIVTRVYKLLDNDDLDGLKALENGTLPPDTVPQDDYDQLQQEKAAADQQIAQLTAQVARLQQENQQLQANATPAPPPRKATAPAAGSASSTASAAAPRHSAPDPAPAKAQPSKKSLVTSVVSRLNR